MRFGPKCEGGFLTVYSVDTEDEARELLTLACETNFRGEFIAKELVHEQSIENLFAFGRRLAEAHEFMKSRRQKGSGPRGRRKR